MDKSQQLLFALDIGTRSVVGLVGQATGGVIKLVASDREEHYTRAMLDGQIHDVREVAGVLASVKNRLEAAVGPLTTVAVAAAGRALCTLRATAELDTATRAALLPDDERSLEMAAIQSAQQQLSTGSAVPDPADYYCVGYSVVHFTLDGTHIKSLVGQRAKSAGIEVIATFLPRQVIDSLQSALEAVGLEMTTLTLEPIAAINVLIPSTMRHLNLALVDVGAGTSDIAITKDGSVIAYGMVPFAGDEITEAISEQFLLDFNVAETVKRQVGGKNKKIAFTDVLGMPQKLAAKEIISAMVAKVGELAQAIATEIIALNTAPPQAVLLVGGGSLTPLLPEALAEALDIPAARVAIRRPDSLEGFTDIPVTLCTPDAVTPLGILKLAGGRSFNFINVSLNNRPIRLFNLSSLTVADALLSAGISIRTLRGRPGMGLTITVNGQTQFLPGSHGTAGKISLNGQPAKLSDGLHDQDVITVSTGTDGLSPAPRLDQVTPVPPPITLTVNGSCHVLEPQLSVNSQPATGGTCLKDRDQVECILPSTVSQVLTCLGLPPEPIQYLYKINQVDRTYKVWPPQYTVNGIPAPLDSPVVSGDVIATLELPPPALSEIIGLASDTDQYISVLFNNVTCPVPVCRHTLLVDGRQATLDQTPPNGSTIDYTSSPDCQPLVSDVLLAAKFDPRSLPPTGRITVLLNGQPAEYTTVVQNGDSIEIKVRDC